MTWSESNTDAETLYSCHCTPTTCRERCGHEIVDVLLHEQADKDPALTDALLDLKFALTHRRDVEEILHVFCNLRRRLEKRYYLAFYRLRRWLENQLEAQVSPGRGYPPQPFPVRLEARTVDGIKHSIRKAAREKDPAFPKSAFPVIEFTFHAPSRTSPSLLA